MAGANVKQVIMIVVSLIVIAVIFPMGIGLVSVMGDSLITVVINTTSGEMGQVALSTIVDPAVLTLLTILLPILAVIGILMYFIPRAND